MVAVACKLRELGIKYRAMSIVARTATCKGLENAARRNFRFRERPFRKPSNRGARTQCVSGVKLFGSGVYLVNGHKNVRPNSDMIGADQVRVRAGWLDRLILCRKLPSRSIRTVEHLGGEPGALERDESLSGFSRVQTRRERPAAEEKTPLWSVTIKTAQAQLSVYAVKDRNNAGSQSAREISASIEDCTLSLRCNGKTNSRPQKGESENENSAGAFEGCCAKPQL